MKTTNINGNDLLAAGYTQGKILGVALGLWNKHYNELEAVTAIALFKDVNDRPEAFLDDPVLEELATMIIEEAKVPANDTIVLKTTVADYAIYGEEHIDKGAK